MSTENDDGDNEPPEAPPTSTRPVESSSKWRAATYVSSQVATRIQPMLDAAVASVVRQLRYDNQSHLPCFVTTRLQDPFIALSYHVDAEQLYQKGIADISAAMRVQEQTASSSSSSGAKHKSLRRTLTGKIKPVKVDESSGDDARRHINELDHERSVAERIEAEARGLSIRLSRTVDVFVEQLCAIANLNEKAYKHDLLTFAPYVLVDPSVSRHPKFDRLKLGDNRMVLEIGRAEVRSFVLMETYAQAYHVENAERRCKELESQASVWLASKCAATTIDEMLPVQWHLDAQTHEPLDADTLEPRAARMRNELPFIMIGVLTAMRMRAEAAEVIWSLYQKII